MRACAYSHLSSKGLCLKPTSDSPYKDWSLCSTYAGKEVRWPLSVRRTHPRRMYHVFSRPPTVWVRYAVGVLPPALELLPIGVLQDAIEPEHGTQRLPSLGERPIDGLTCLHVHCIAVRIQERARRRLLAALHLHAVQRIRWRSERLGGRAGITDHLLRVVPPRVTEQAQAPHGQKAVRPEGGPRAGRPPASLPT